MFACKYSKHNGMKFLAYTVNQFILAATYFCVFREKEKFAKINHRENVSIDILLIMKINHCENANKVKSGKLNSREISLFTVSTVMRKLVHRVPDLEKLKLVLASSNTAREFIQYSILILSAIKNIC